ncbi:hypothetical protein [Pseudodesulfovibrio sp. JC047]|uniref:hypothetical protein n=1 Tax=Pseudodesulfovibrio sp. JC047 TaxID=2683199 RepID=UPI0013D18DCC|nr:hypothetical protein [Pseudodesulfovibrio sp. JC047]
MKQYASAKDKTVTRPIKQGMAAAIFLRKPSKKHVAVKAKPLKQCQMTPHRVARNAQYPKGNLAFFFSSFFNQKKQKRPPAKPEASNIFSHTI